MERNTAAERLIIAARELSAALSDLRFAPPVSHVYNPLTYAWSAHADYLQRYGGGKKRVVFLGMKPGQIGMVQCGIPFGEVRLARDWLGIDAPIGKPALLNPHRPVEGWDCRRSEVSGRRLWGLFQQRYGSAAAFFTEHFVVNYCPLAFFDHGRNLTPDKLPPTETASLFAACDEHLRQVITALQPEWLIAVGGFAEVRARVALAGFGVSIGRILHPSPASPAANRGWAAAAAGQLLALGVWYDPSGEV